MSISSKLLRVALLGGACLSPLSVTAMSSVEDALTTLRANASGALQHTSNTVDAYTVLRATGTAVLLADQVGVAPENRARAFLAQFGSVLGVSDAASEFSLARISQDRAGNTHVHLNQMHAGVPVFGARLVVHMNQHGIRGVNGVFVPNLSALNMQPARSAMSLDAEALRQVQKTNPNADLSVTSSQLLVYRSGMLRGVDGQNYLAREVVTRSAKGDVRERVFMDTQRGAVINRINEIHSVKNREIYTPNQDVPPIITEGGATAPADVPLSGDAPSDPASRIPRAPQDNLYIFAGGTYDLYANMFGREGYDDGDTPVEEQVQKSVYLINDACPNAYWNGDSTNYCPGFDADDVVSHEWSHAYTEYTHGLVYQYQSGALNESYSDIFGEVYDLVNGIEGPLGVTLTEGEYFENGGSRWVMGEDLSETAAAALLRDMWDPDGFGANVPLVGIQVLNTGSPGSVITSENYYCDSGDGGGVHTNSAVPNHAFAMLVDGKEFNNVTIPAIGMTRAAQIYFHAALNYQTPTTNFAQHADALEQSCADLIGAPLTDAQGNASPDVINAATCDAIAAAMLSVEMRQSPKEKCNYQPLLLPEAETPAVCASGQMPVARFMQDWEAATLPQDWTITANVTGDTSEDLNWSLIDELPAPHAGQAIFMVDSGGGSCAAGGDISGSFRLDSPTLTVQSGDAWFQFDHLMQSEFGYDGGNLKFSLNGADFAVVPTEAFSFNAYNDEFAAGSTLPAPDPSGLVSGNNTNPMAGELAWTGSDEGESFSNWGTSVVDLAALGVAAGDTVQFRFEFGQDGCGGNLGWYVDDVSLGYCALDDGSVAPVPTPAPTSPPNGGTGGENPGAGVTGARGGAMGVWMLMLLGGVFARRRVQRRA